MNIIILVQLEKVESLCADLIENNYSKQMEINSLNEEVEKFKGTEIQIGKLSEQMKELEGEISQKEVAVSRHWF